MTRLSFLLLIATSAFAAASQPEVVVYTSVDQVYSAPLLREFEKATGIQVKAVYDVEASKTVGLAMRLEAEKDRPKADVFWNNEFLQTLRLNRLGLFTPSGIPSQALPQFLTSDGMWVGLGARARVFLVNKNLVQPEDYPRSLRDLGAARYPAGKTGMALPLFGTTATQAAAMVAKDGKTDTLLFFQKIKALAVRMLPGNSTVRDLVVSGELAFGLTDSDDAQGALDRGAPVEVIAPDQDTTGTFVVFGTVAMLKNCSHPEEAKKLIEFLLAAENRLVATGAFQWSLQDATCAMFPQGLKTWDIAPEKILEQYPVSSQEMRELFVK